MTDFYVSSEDGIEENLEQTMEEEFRQRFELTERTLGHGTFSVVKLGRDLETDRNCAIKIVDLPKLEEESDITSADLLREAEIHLQLKHPFVVEMMDSYYMSGKMLMIFEYMEGEDICFEVVSRANDGYTYCESVISFYTKQILEAVNHCHSLNIIHRDIKPQNILMMRKDNKSPVKLNDFGIAVQLQDNEFCNPGRIGTPHFMAPEVIARVSYGKEADIWSVGVLFFLLLSGTLPYNGSGDSLYERIENGIPEDNASAWDVISDMAKDLLDGMLKHDSRERVTAAEALQHPFLRTHKNCSKTHLQDTIDGLSKFNNGRKFKRCVTGALMNKSDVTEDGQDMDVRVSNKSKLLPACQMDIVVDEMSIVELGDNVLETLAEIHHLTDADNANFDIVRAFLSNPQVKTFLQMYEKLHEPVIVEESLNRYEMMSAIEETYRSSDVELPELVELQNILSKPHVLGLMTCIDTISNNYEENNQAIPNGIMSAYESDNVDKVLVRLVEFEKPPNTRLGMTVKMKEDKRCFVVRVMHNGFIHQQGTIHTDDEIIEVNGIVVSHLSPSKLRQIMLSLSGKVSLKVIPSIRQSTQAVQCYLKAQFSYIPDKDDQMPCKHLGLSFSIGDILEVVNKDDAKWWQAKSINNPEIIGLIPCPELREWTYCHRPHKHTPASWFNSLLNSKKKQIKEIYDSDNSSAFDVFDIPSYEDVMQVDFCKRKSLVLLGATGVGKRQVKTALIKSNPARFASPAIDTTRQPRMGEVSGKVFNFLTKPEMLRKIEDREYLEHRSFELDKNQQEYFGIAYRAVRDVQESGKMAVIDVEPQALKVLRSKEFLPYVIFITPPSYDQLGSLCDIAAFHSKGISEEAITRIIRDSQKIEDRFQHYFDLIIHHENVENTVSEITSALDQMQAVPQWIPTSWIY